MASSPMERDEPRPSPRPLVEDSSSRRRSLDSASYPKRPVLPSLDQLPEELLERIAHFLNVIPPKDPPRRDENRIPMRRVWRARYLHSFCLVSRKFRRVATPLLYSIFINDEQPAALHQFLGTIMANPDLAAHVRAVIIGDFDEDLEVADFSDEELGIPAECSEQARANIVERAEKIDFGSRAEDHRIWLERLQHGSFEADIAFLLSQTPNLELLDLETDQVAIHDLYTWTFLLIQLACSDRDMHTPQRFLSKLHHVVIRDTTPLPVEGPTHLFQGVLSLPSLRTLHLRDVTDCPSRMIDLFDRSANVEKFIFQESVFYFDFFYEIVRAFRRLKSLTYQMGWSGLDNHDIADMDWIRDAALIHEGSLETLTLEAMMPIDWVRYSSIGSLQSFTRLRHLKISGVLLFGPTNIRQTSRNGDTPKFFPEDLFPKSLQTLWIDFHRFPVYPPVILDLVLEVLIDGRSKGLLPNLCHVQLTVPLCNQDEESKSWDSLLRDYGPRLAASGKDELNFAIRVIPEPRQLIFED